MSGIILANGTPANGEAKIDTQGGLRVSPYHPDIGGNGAYRLAAYTGLLTVIAAGSASAGHIFAARWTHATKLALVTRLWAKWRTIAGFTAAQEVGLEALITRNYTAGHTGGTALTLVGDAYKKKSAHGTQTFQDLRISTTGALGNGTHTIDTQPIAANFFAELAAAATVPKGAFDILLEVSDMATHPIVLSQNTGIIIRNGPTAMGAGGTARVVVEMDWLEVDAY